MSLQDTGCSVKFVFFSQSSSTHVVKFSHHPKVLCPFSLHEQWKLIGEGIHPQECIRKRIKKTCKCGQYAMLSYVVYVVINKNYMMLGCEGTGW